MDFRGLYSNLMNKYQNRTTGYEKKISTELKTDQERKVILENYIIKFLGNYPNYSLKTKNDLTVVFSRPADKINHVLHLLLSIITFGFWIFVWILLTIGKTKASSHTARIDEFGNIHTS
jgi:hypothetical protein